jgi:pimeloyl-ACP methyl ester carboxylesterase
VEKTFVFQRLSRGFTFLILMVFFSGCYPPARVPLETIRYEVKNAPKPRVLIIYLPGNGDSLSAAQKKGLVSAIRDRGIQADIIAVNAHVGYYVNGSILTRLKEDVVDPARADGYTHLWLVGNSLGAYGSLSYAREHPDEISGLVLLGPYLGNKALLNGIKQAGGLRKWAPDNVENNSQEDRDKLIWLWLKDCGKQKLCSEHMYLGYGLDDRFSYAQNYLASLMPPEHVLAIDGGHDWPTWETAWTRFLQKDIFELNR